MKTYNAKSVFDLDKFLPGDGEDSVELMYKDGTLYVYTFLCRCSVRSKHDAVN
jgi:hypothetical protein